MVTYNWKEFLEQWAKDRTAVDDVFKYHWLYNPTPTWELKPSATEEQLAQLETLLQKPLPPSYRQFLQASNGWDLVYWHNDWIFNKIEDIIEPKLKHSQGRLKAKVSKPLIVGSKIHFLEDIISVYSLNPKSVNEEWEASWEIFYDDYSDNSAIKCFANFTYSSFWDMVQDVYQKFKETTTVLLLAPIYSHEQKGLFYNWYPFLKQWSKEFFKSGLYNVLVEKEDDYILEKIPEETKEKQWIGLPGLSEAQIIEVERKLGTKLPPSYRQFLQVTNGWPYMHEAFLQLWSVDSVDWMGGDGFYRKHYFSEKAETIPDEEYFDYSTQESGYIIRSSHLEAALEIGGNDGNDFFLLNPLGVNEEGEWEAWYWLNEGGATRYPSFWHMMQERYYSLFVQ